jgi:hypothetical protein
MFQRGTRWWKFPLFGKKTGIQRNTVGFIDSHRQRAGRGSIFEYIFLWWIPKDCVIHGRITEILSDTGDPGGQPVNLFSLKSVHGYLDYQLAEQQSIP